MNKFLKKLMTFGLCVGMFAGIGLGFVGCNEPTPEPGPPVVDNDHDKDKDPDKNPDVQNPDKGDDKKPDNNPVNPPVTEKKTLEEAEAEFDAFMQKLTTGKNFTYTLENDSRDLTAEFAGDKMKLADNGEVTYLTEENDENFVIGLEDDDAWHKDFAEDNMTIDYAISTVTDALEDVNWTAYDSNTNVLSGDVSTTIDGTPIIAKVDANFDQDDMSVKMKSGLTTTNMSVSKIGTTTVTLPENVIDETAQNNNIFTVDQNGEYVWNVKAIKDVLEPWLKNEGEGNQYGKDVAAKMRGNDNYLTREIVYINPTKDKISFGMIYDVNGQLRFGESYFLDTYLYENLLNKPLTKIEFKDYLMQVDARRIITSFQDINVEYTTHDQDYETEHKQEFETLTKNVFEKYHKEKTANDPDYNGAKVLFAFKTPMGPVNLGYDGDGRSWGQYYLLEHNGEITLIEANGVRGLVAGLGPLQNVLQNQEGKWKIGYGIQTITQISKENKELFSEPLMTIGKQTNLSKE